MQRTSNYQLPQWEKSDRIMMEDFNDTMSKIESAIDGAKSEASAALTEAKRTLFSRENKPYITGTYKGNGNSQTIQLGFRPSLLFISKQTLSTEANGVANVGYMYTGDGTISDNKPVVITDTGFTVTRVSGGPNVNWNGEDHLYVAFF